MHFSIHKANVANFVIFGLILCLKAAENCKFKKFPNISLNFVVLRFVFLVIILANWYL